MPFYRFKTEQEFKDKVKSSNWMNTFNWNRAMNVFFGQPFTPPNFRNWENYEYDSLNGYRVTPNMLVELSEQDYNTLLNEFNRIGVIDSKEGTYAKPKQIVIDDEHMGTQILLNPTGNCQLMMLANFCYLLDYYTDPEDMMRVLRTIVMKTGISKPLIFFDVNNDYEEQIDQLPLLSKTPYTSSNGSIMIHGIIQL